MSESRGKSQAKLEAYNTVFSIKIKKGYVLGNTDFNISLCLWLTVAYMHSMHEYLLVCSGSLNIVIKIKRATVKRDTVTVLVLFVQRFFLHNSW